MRLLVSLLLVLSCGQAATTHFTYLIAGEDPGPWPQLLASAGLRPGTGMPVHLFIVRDAPAGSADLWLKKIEAGNLVVLEGPSELAEALGLHDTGKRLEVRSLIDQRAPRVPVVWEQATELAVHTVPATATVFAQERWAKVPLMVGVRRGAGAVLWLAAPLGETAYQRFPYVLQALTDLGLGLPFRSLRLSAFFDSAYRSRVDPDYFAARWRMAGIATLHVAAWHNFEADPQQDAYLKSLIEACHRQGIGVYAWLELPHVSERFWADHPEWREKTAILQDAQLDWRKLINLSNPKAFAAVSEGVRQLLQRFDWDGVNLAELYFESLEGTANAARFTPMNDDVRNEFKASHGGLDPLELFNNPALSARMPEFLEYRAGLALRYQQAWIEEIERLRVSKPDLDLVLTHVDDRFDQHMRDAIGANAAAVLPMLEQHNFTFLIEDPATVWNQGAERYGKIAAAYQPLTKRTDKLGIDINVVERYQDVYPTKQQTGTELFELVHQASAAFSKVALYFENSIVEADWPVLPAAAAMVQSVEMHGTKLIVTSKDGAGLAWKGPALVDGKPWPVRDEATVWLPAGKHQVEPGTADAPIRLLDLNAALKTAVVVAGGVEFGYQSEGRAFAVLNARPKKFEIDGQEAEPVILESGKNHVLVLPRGQHIVSATL